MTIAEQLMKKGWSKGKQEGIQQTALNLLKQNISLAVISNATGLSPEKIKSLQEEEALLS